MPLFEKRDYYKPFEYPWAYNYAKTQDQMHWMEEEVPLAEDVNDFHQKLSPSNQLLVSNILKYFTQADCFKEGTKILTDEGWKDFKHITYEDKVAQFDPETQEITFTMPLAIHKKRYEGNLIRFYADRKPIDVSVTPNHMMLHTDLKGRIQKIPADTVKLYQRKHVWLGGKGVGNLKNLSWLDRFNISFQADGNVKHDIDGSKLGFFHVYFTFSKERKIVRLRNILDNLGWTYFEKPIFLDNPKHNDQICFKIQCPFKPSKDITTWMPKLSEISNKWAEEFVEEVSHWDSWIDPDSNIYYSNTDQDVASLISAICVLGNYGSIISIRKDDREVHYKDVAKVKLNNSPKICCQYIKKVEEEYDGYVYCVTVPKGNIVVQSNGRSLITGNCDVASGYIDHYMPLFKPVELRMMMAKFTAMEATHISAYSSLVDTLGLPEDTYQMFMQYKSMVDKHEYLSNFGTETLEDLAKTIAVFSALTEGVQLFSSFAILLNFQRHNLMKGMGQIVTWSIRDECVSADHSVLTPSGWVPFPSLKDGEKVAQFDPATKEISFVVPSRVIRKPFKGELKGVDKRHFSILATPNHDVLLANGKKTKMSEFFPANRKRIPTAGYINSDNDRRMTALEKLMVAYAADGQKIQGPYRNGNHVGYQRVTFALKKERKIERLIALAEEANIVWDELDGGKNFKDSGQRKFALNFPQGKALKDLHSWVHLEDVTPSWGNDFLNEVVQWDGSVIDKLTYCTTNAKDAELVQTIAHLCGNTATMIISQDNRKESYKDYYRVTLWDQIDTPSGSGANLITQEYEGTTYCVTVPTGAFLVKRNNRIHATGNCLHVEAMTKVFRTLIEEHPELWTDSLKYAIYSAAERVIELEDAFIDTVYDNGATTPDLTPEQVKQHIRYIAGRRLQDLGLKNIFGVYETPLDWLEVLLNGIEHTNFFENRATEYARAATTGSWGDVFK